jgi:hypothetical protein
MRHARLLPRSKMQSIFSAPGAGGRRGGVVNRHGVLQHQSSGAPVLIGRAQATSSPLGFFTQEPPEVVPLGTDFKLNVLMREKLEWSISFGVEIEGPPKGLLRVKK